MGSHPNIQGGSFPKQGEYLGKKVQVLLGEDPTQYEGTVVRDDYEEPFLTIIRLEDDRHVLSTECLYSTPRI